MAKPVECRIVGMPDGRFAVIAVLASGKVFRHAGLTSLAEAVVADSSTKRKGGPCGVVASCVTIRANVVLPEPGGPHSTMEGMCPLRRRARSDPRTTSSCPTYSSSECGRMRSAKGRVVVRRALDRGASF